MGHDGLEGSKMLVNKGGTLVAQNEETSVVWGMPGAVSEAGICHAILPLDEIGGKVMRLVKGGKMMRSEDFELISGLLKKKIRPYFT